MIIRNTRPNQGQAVITGNARPTIIPRPNLDPSFGGWGIKL